MPEQFDPVETEIAPVYVHMNPGAPVYVHMNPGASVGTSDGTREHPYADFTEALALAAGGTPTRVLAAGIGRISDGSALLTIGATHAGKLSIEAWENPAAFGWNDEPPTFYGGVEIETFGAADGTNTSCYRVSGLLAKPAGVACDWLNRQLSNGARYGWYQERESLELCEANPGSWYWDGSLLWVHDEASANLESDATPSGRTLEWFRPGQGILVQNTSGIALKGLRVWGTVDPGNALGYGIRHEACSDCITEACEAIDTGYHSIGAAGNTSIDITYTDCVSEGGAPTQDSYMVFYGSTADVESCVATRCIVRMRPLLRWDSTLGTPVAITNANGTQADSQLAYTQHTGGSVVIAAGGVKWTDCSATYVWPELTFGSLRYLAIGNGSKGSVPSDLADFDTYPVQVTRMAATCSGLYIGTTAAAFIACRNCFFYGPNSNDVGGADGTNNMFVRLPSVTGGVTMLFEGCVIMAESTSGGSLVRMLGTSTLYDRSNTWIALGSTGVTHSRTAGQTIDSDQSVFIGTARICGGSTTGTGFSYTAGVYPTGLANYGPSAATNSEAEWAVHDPLGLFPADTGDFDAATGEPDAGTTVRDTKTAPVELYERGINRRKWSGNYGAFQYGHLPHVETLPIKKGRRTGRGMRASGMRPL